MALIYSKLKVALTGWGVRTPQSYTSQLYLVSTASIRKVIEWPLDGIEPWPSATNGQQTKDTINSTGARGQCAQAGTVTAVGLLS